MKKINFLTFWLLLTVVVFNSCNTKNYLLTNDKGVIINGVKWATRNGDNPGTFAAKPEAPGMFFQWNRKAGWNVTDPMINSNGGTTWDGSDVIGATWEKSNDPSPVGWRIPSFDEIEKLLDENKVKSEWTTVKGIKGRRFSDKTSGKSLFLPAVGRRSSDGTPDNAGSDGDYWSNTVHESHKANVYGLFFYSDGAYRSSSLRNYGLSVRCVATK